MQALSLLTIQVLEFNAALVLLKYTAKPQHKFSNFFKNNKLLSDRNWFLSSVLGFGFLVLLICLTSLLADRLFGSKVGDYFFFPGISFVWKNNINHMSNTFVVIVFLLSLLELVLPGVL